MEITSYIDRVVNGRVETDRLESLYYVTVLSNLARGYDKYAGVYDKARIPESTYPSQFFLLSYQDIYIGIRKAASLLAKLGIPENCLIALKTHTGTEELHPSPTNGRGRYVERGWIRVDSMHLVDEAGRMSDVRMEEACALSLRLHIRDGNSYERLVPRSVSILPVAKACQANCPFCFSKASVSTDVLSKPIDWRRIAEALQQGKLHGADRAVITGGGEPSMIGDENLHRLLREAAKVFSKVVLISNGYRWGYMPEQRRAAALASLDDAGLSVLSISRHHFDAGQNAALMNLATQSEQIAKTWVAVRPTLKRLKLRWICVLQRGGIEDAHLLGKYLDWAAESDVEEVCFKELYISTSVESEYFDRAANDWSARHQVPLRIVLDLAHSAGWTVAESLPWGTPIFEGFWRGRRMRVAAYTEPSLYWELANGVCRSWNLMADGRCLASLEDRHSEVLIGGLCELQAAAQ